MDRSEPVRSADLRSSGAAHAIMPSSCAGMRRQRFAWAAVGCCAAARSRGRHRGPRVAETDFAQPNPTQVRPKQAPAPRSEGLAGLHDRMGRSIGSTELRMCSRLTPYARSNHPTTHTCPGRARLRTSRRSAHAAGAVGAAVSQQPGRQAGRQPTRDAAAA